MDQSRPSDSAGHRITSWLHQSAALRKIARRVCHGWTLRQSFHGGVICHDAVEHSWAWTGAFRYASFDRELQEKLLLLSRDHEMLLDLGCNVGAMLLSVTLRNPAIKALGVDPNCRAVELLNKSIAANHLSHRAHVIEAAVADRDGSVSFDETGSVAGHVSASGRAVASVDFARLVNEHSQAQKCLVKIDIEGFETVLLDQLSRLKFRKNLCLVIELHSLGFNQAGDPQRCMRALLESGAKVMDLRDCPITGVAEDQITQVQAVW